MRILAIATGLSAALCVPVQAQVARPVEGVTIEICEQQGQGGECLLPASIGATRNLDDKRITVLASGQWQRLDGSAQAVSVLDLADLKAVQGPDITRALQRLPGVTLVRNGGLGSFAGLSVRGSASERVLVLIDGVRLNDVAAPAGGFDFGSVVSGGIERVELLRGPGSLIWGSDALGGVVHLTTRVADGVEASGEAGGAGQFSGHVALGGSLGYPGKVGISASFVSADGFSTAAGGAERDGFEQLALSARGEVTVSGPFSLFASARYAAGTTQIDGFPAPFYSFADTAEFQDTRQLSARAGAEFEDGYGTLVTVSLAHGDTQRDLVDPAFSPEPYYATQGRATRAEARARVSLSDDLALIGGGDWEWSQFSDGYTSARTDIGSGHAMLAYATGQMGLSSGLRIDRHRALGSALTFAANGFAMLGDRVRARAAYGEGFKAPSLFQLHSDYGNAVLQPEVSRSFEAGLDLWPDARGERMVALTLFRSNSRNLIDFIGCPPLGSGICANRPYGTYDNVGRARSQGLEAEGRVRVIAGVEAGLAYAFTASTNRDTGLRLARRPRHAGTFTLDWQALEALSLGVDLRVVSASFDDPGNTVRLGGHALLDLRASWAASDHVELFGRIENAWDEQYQTAAGYATQGRAAFVGVRGRL
jgi:vitamin B12 transporter